MNSLPSLDAPVAELPASVEGKRALAVETIGMTKSFGSFKALDDVSIKVRPGSFHALLGENGAGKSTLVKCMMGFYKPTQGSLLIDGRETEVATPRDAHARGLGMVYQHFTLIPSLTAAENLVTARRHVPAVVDWKAERKGLEAFLAKMPFRVRLDTKVSDLAAGEKQKLEILKQIYLDCRFLILDEPTSVLTPQEAEEVLGLLRGMTVAGNLTILMITHKFREVNAFADEVSVLRRGRHVGGGLVAELTRDQMAAMMIGSKTIQPLTSRVGAATDSTPILELTGVTIDGAVHKELAIDSLTVRRNEIVGIAGVSGNGQKALADVIGGQRAASSGEMKVSGVPYHATREETRAEKVRFIPEEPLRNACAPRMSVVANLNFRTFDLTEAGKRTAWLHPGAMKKKAKALIEAFKVKAPVPSGPIAALSGGNVQRAVLARELTGEVDLLVVANPCFGLDFSAVAEIRSRIVAARNAGAAVLLISEDLDEILELSDRILVMSEGKIVYETSAAKPDIAAIGQHMAGHH